MITPLKIGLIWAELGRWFGLPAAHHLAKVRAKLPLFCFHLALPGRSVLVDAAAYEFEAKDARFAVPGSAEPSLVAQLAKLGIAPTNITDVVLTHAHFDHINGVTQRVNGPFSGHSTNRFQPTFANARHYLGRADWRPNGFNDLETRTLGVLHENNLLQLVDGRLPLGDGLTIIPAPGETPGHQLLLLETAVKSALFLGDLYHHSLEFAEPERCVVWADRPTMQASKTMVRQLVGDQPIDLYFSHIAGCYRLNDKLIIKG